MDTPQNFEFDDAYLQLLSMVKEIENDNISLSDLAAKIGDAKALVHQCESALREAEEAVDKAQEDE